MLTSAAAGLPAQKIHPVKRNPWLGRLSCHHGFHLQGPPWGGARPPQALLDQVQDPSPRQSGWLLCHEPHHALSARLGAWWECQ